MIKKFISTIMLFSIATSIFAQANESILGKWKGEEKKDLVIEIYKASDGFFYGKNQQGKLVLNQLKFDSKSNIYKGKMSPPDKDISLDISLFFESSEKLKLVAKKFLMTKTIYLTKIK